MRRCKDRQRSINKESLLYHDYNLKFNKKIFPPRAKEVTAVCKERLSRQIIGETEMSRNR